MSAISEIKFRNLEDFGGNVPLPDGRNCHDLRWNELRKELELLGVPVTSDMPKSRMIGRYVQVLEHLSETLWHATRERLRKSP